MSARRLLSHPFVADNLWFGATSFLVNLLNYAYILMALNFLNKESFGAFNALVAILTLATVAANPLLLQVAKQVSSIRTGVLARYFLDGNRKIFTGAGAGFLVLVAVSPYLSTLLNLPRGSIVFVWVVATALITATFANGISSGLKKLKFQSLLNLSATVAKFLLGWLLFKAGLGLNAGLAGYLAGFALTAAATWRALRRWEDHEQEQSAEGGRQESLAVLVLAYLFVMTPFSIDQIYVQTLNREVSGDYAALATLGKLVFFVSSPFLVVMYSYLVRARHNSVRLARYFLLGTLVSVGAAVSFTALLWIGGRSVVGLLLPPAYLGVSRWVLAYSLGMCGYVFCYAVALLGIVRNDFRTVGLIGIASIVQAGLFLGRHATMDQLVANQVLCLAVLSVAAVACLVASPLTLIEKDR